jgi:hypothetical protein
MLGISKLEYHESMTGFNASYFIKNFVFMFGIAIIYPNLITILYNSFTMSLNELVLFSNTAGIQVIQYILSQALLSKGLELIMDTYYLVMEYLKNGKMKRIEFYAMDDYALNVTLFGIVVVFGGIAPFTWLAGLWFCVFSNSEGMCYFFICYWVDKWRIMHICKLHNSNGSIMFTICVMLAIYILMIPFVMSTFVVPIFGIVSSIIVTLVAIAIFGSATYFAFRWYLNREVKKLLENEKVLDSENSNLVIKGYEQPFSQELYKAAQA